MAGGRGHYVYHITVAKLVLERDYPAIDLGAAAGQADLGMDRKRKVYGRRSARQLDDLSLGRKTIDLVRVQVELELVQEFAGVFDLLLPLDQALEPDECFIL